MTRRNPAQRRPGLDPGQRADLLAAREVRGWTIPDLAARVGLRPTVVLGIETGTHTAGPRSLAALRRALGCGQADRTRPQALYGPLLAPADA